MKAVSDYTDPKELERLMANAKRLGREDVYWEAFARLCKLEGDGKGDALHCDFYATLRAYEELLSVKNGRTTKANRTRQKLARHGVVKCLEDWAGDTKETQGFTLLVENNLVELTGEFLVLKHPTHFSSDTIASARKRLQAVRDREEFRKAFDAAGISF
jgi:hypothetical protein